MPLVNTGAKGDSTPIHRIYWPGSWLTEGHDAEKLLGKITDNVRAHISIAYSTHDRPRKRNDSNAKARCILYSGLLV